MPTVEAIAGAFANAIRQSFATEQTSGSQLAAPPRLKLVRNQLTRYVHLPFGPPLIVFRVLAPVHRPRTYERALVGKIELNSNMSNDEVRMEINLRL